MPILNQSMKIFFYDQLERSQVENLTLRSAINLESVYEIVKPIMSDVRKRGDRAIYKYSEEFDGLLLDSLVINKDEIKSATENLNGDVKKAIQQAAVNIEKFHRSQIVTEDVIETMPGVFCFREYRPIERVGLYIPGGTAPLPSTVLMLGIPAKIAGCGEIVLCSPPKIASEILYAADMLGIDKIFQVGGAQAVAGMTYGTETVPKVDKIFGPGNQYVTAAKMLSVLDGMAIDMPAGPSELLVIGDEAANAEFVAADLLSQAEHGVDSQVVLLCFSENFADRVLGEINKQMQNLPRKKIIMKSLSNSFVIVCSNIEQAFDFANRYAPEHLILNLSDADKLVPRVINAGSVFLGNYSCESAGDYASGTNHVLPTSGFAKAYSGVSVDSFQKKITFQSLSEEGVKNIGPIVEEIADCEQLQAHKNAMTLRINSLKE